MTTSWGLDTTWRHGDRATVVNVVCCTKPLQLALVGPDLLLRISERPRSLEGVSVASFSCVANEELQRMMMQFRYTDKNITPLHHLFFEVMLLSIAGIICT
mmetsp:Transcript_5621/g.7842  ORF Transcript_5621/g.7842 Transcript_5621/m.7842 type:complete len:101 (-) Transcript_5621:383-685(-)